MKFNFKSLTSALCLALALASFSACGGGDETTTTPAAPVITDGSQSKAQLAGYGFSCAILGAAGTTLNGKQLVRYISLLADGTYTYSSNVVDGTSCSFGHSAGGAQVSWSQFNASGTWAVNGTNTLPTTAATRIDLTPTTQYLTIYTTGPIAGAVDMANWANGCSGWAGSGNVGASGFSLSANTTRSNFSPTVCASTGNVNMGVPPTVGVVQYNTANRATNLQTGAVINMYSPNAGTYPTTYSITWQ